MQCPPLPLGRYEFERNIFHRRPFTNKYIPHDLSSRTSYFYFNYTEASNTKLLRGKKLM